MSNFLNLSVGAEFGYFAEDYRYKADTIRQGGNYLLAIPYEALQVGLVLKQVSEITSKFTNYPMLTQVAFGIGIIAYQAFSKVVAYRKFTEQQQNFREASRGSISVSALITQVEKSLKIDKFIPTKLFYFLADHNTKIIHGVAVVVAIAKYYMGMRHQALGAFTMLGIGFLNSRGFFPRKFTVFYENHLYILMSCIGLIYGSKFQKVFSLVSLIFAVRPLANYALTKLDDYLVKKDKKNLNVDYPTLRSLETVENPSQPRSILTMQDIERIREDGEGLLIDFEHVTRTPQVKKPEGKVDYSDLLTYFDSFDLNNEGSDLYPVLEKKLMNDSRAQSYIAPTLIEIKKLRKEKREVPKELKQVLVTWARSELVHFVNVMKGTERPPGDITHMEQAQEQVKLVVAHLKTVQNDDQKSEKMKRMEISTFVLRLAVEGGHYCGPQVKAAAKEMFNLIIGKYTDFRGRLDLALEAHRERLFENRILRRVSLSSVFNSDVQVAADSDLHTANFKKSIFGRGMGFSNSNAIADKSRKGNNFFLMELVSVYATSFLRAAVWQNVYPQKNRQFADKNKLDKSICDSISELQQASLLRKIPTVFRGIKKVLTAVHEYVMRVFINMPDLDYYTPQAIRELFAEYFQTEEITGEEINTWYQIYATKFDETEQGILFELFWGENGLIDENQKIRLNSKALNILLVEMGYLKLNKPT